MGQTLRDHRQRWREHCNCALHGSRGKFSRAIRKYGPSHFSIRVLARAQSTSQLNQLEQKWITKLNSVRHGYNSKVGIGSGEHSIEARQKMSRAKLGKPSNNSGGYHLSAETRKKMSAAKRRLRPTRKLQIRTKKVYSHHKVLTVQQLRWAVKRWKSRRKTQVQLAAVLNVTQPTISNIVMGKVYQKVTCKERMKPMKPRKLKPKPVSPMAWLTARQVLYIRRHREQRQVDLAVRFGVTQATISNVLTRRTYKQVE